MVGDQRSEVRGPTSDLRPLTSGSAPRSPLPARRRKPRLHPLHLRLDRPSQGRDGHAPQPGQRLLRLAAGLSAGQRRPLAPADGQLRLRCLRRRHGPRAVLRRKARDLPQGDPARPRAAPAVDPPTRRSISASSCRSSCATWCSIWKTPIRGSTPCGWRSSAPTPGTWPSTSGPCGDWGPTRG